MRLASLFSGGKDSTYSIYLAQKQGHEIKCLLTIIPKSEESHLLHHPNLKWVYLQSESMGLPLLSVESDSDETSNELRLMKRLLVSAINDYAIEGLVHGGIKSKFQKDNFENLCNDLGLQMISPIWDSEDEQYMEDLLNSNFEFILTSVSSEGLDDSWLGKKLKFDDLERMKTLAKKFHFNLNFEGGEAESFVLNCPLFSKPIEIIKGQKFWDGYRGRFEIREARLNYDAR